MQPRWWGCLGWPCCWLGRWGGVLGGWRRRRQLPSWQVGAEEASDIEDQAPGGDRSDHQRGQQWARFKGPEEQHRPTVEEEEERQWRVLAGERGPPSSQAARLQEQTEECVEQQQLGSAFMTPAGGVEQQQPEKRAQQAARPVCRSLLGLPIMRPDSVAVRAWDGFMSLLDLTYTGELRGQRRALAARAAAGTGPCTTLACAPQPQLGYVGCPTGNPTPHPTSAMHATPAALHVRCHRALHAEINRGPVPAVWSFHFRGLPIAPSSHSTSTRSPPPAAYLVPLSLAFDDMQGARFTWFNGVNIAGSERAWRQLALCLPTVHLSPPRGARSTP